MKAISVIDNLKLYIHSQIDNMAKTTPIINIMKPLVYRAIDNNFNRVHTAINLIADENGEVDIENIISEMMDNLSNTQPFTLHTSFFGDIELGAGLIKANIPFTDKKIVFNRTDLETFKALLTNKD